MDEQPTPRGQASQPRKQKWAPRHYNRPEGYYSRVGKIGGAKPHDRPPGFFQRIGAMGGSAPHRKTAPAIAAPARALEPVSPPKVTMEQPKPASPRGEMTVREAGHRGGSRTREVYGLEFYAVLGRAGGRSLLESRGRDHFVSIGQAGADTTLEKYGKEHFTVIGKAGGAATKEKYGREHFAEIGRKGGLAAKGEVGLRPGDGDS